MRSERADFDYCGKWFSRVLPLILLWSFAWFLYFYSDCPWPYSEKEATEQKKSNHRNSRQKINGIQNILKSLLISSSSFINSDESNASFNTLAEKMVSVSKKLISGRLFDSILDLNWMNDLFSSKAFLLSDAFRKMIQLYALAILVAFSWSFFFSEKYDKKHVNFISHFYFTSRNS